MKTYMRFIVTVRTIIKKGTFPEAVQDPCAFPRPSLFCRQTEARLCANFQTSYKSHCSTLNRHHVLLVSGEYPFRTSSGTQLMYLASSSQDIPTTVRLVWNSYVAASDVRSPCFQAGSSAPRCATIPSPPELPAFGTCPHCAVSGSFNLNLYAPGPTGFQQRLCTDVHRNCVEARTHRRIVSRTFHTISG
jgi:hypothetical protein